MFGAVKRHYRKAKNIRAGRKALGISPLKMLGYQIGDAREQHASNKAYKKTHGKAAYKKAKKEDKATRRFYDRKHYG